MLPKELDGLIDFALADGVVTDKEREILCKKAENLGVDKDEFEMILEAKIHTLNAESMKAQAPPTPQVEIQQKSNKEGEIKKCPACGAPVSAFTTQCSDCNHEFRTSQSSLQDLTNSLNSIPRPERSGLLDLSFHAKAEEVGSKRADLILNHSIPNYKENILEFLAFAMQFSGSSGFTGMLKSQLTGGYDAVKQKEADAWMKKAKQIIFKARVSFKSDQETLSQIEGYAKKLKL